MPTSKTPIGSGYNILVAIEDGKVVGYICFGPTPVHGRHLGHVLGGGGTRRSGGGASAWP